MKKLIIILLFVITFAACKKEKNPLSKLKEATKNIKNTKKVFDNVQDAQKEMMKLKDLEPISNEVIKAWMPDNLDNLKRTSYKLGKPGYINISMIDLEFKDPEDKKKKVNVQIIDGAGAGSAAIYMYKMIQNTDMETENETGYEKTYKRGKVFIKEKYQNEKYGNRTKMEFLVDDRFAVSATGYDIKPDELWEYLEKLKINKLK